MIAMYTFSRIGFHYYPDVLHYRQADLQRWLPELLRLKASWVTLLASHTQAVPEFFLRGLVEAGIQPVLHMPFAPSDLPNSADVEVLLSNYARWGVQQIAFFDRPNLRPTWQSEGWTRSNLVERFLDLFIPFAEAAQKYGLRPVFPPLEPGGDYWDLAFLQSALESLRRRGKQMLLDELILGAYAWAGNRPLNWGTGGPERWSASRPYLTPETSQDQLGFRIFDWYQAAARSALGASLPILLLRAGSRPGDASYPHLPALDLAGHAQANLTLYQLAAAANLAAQPAGLDALPGTVMGCCFWLLACANHSAYRSQAWFQPGDSRLPVVNSIERWLNQLPQTAQDAPKDINSAQPIEHYLLLPTYPWGVSDWHLQAIQPFVKKYRPTIGFSLAEARSARRVTLIGDSREQLAQASAQLSQNGCLVEEIISTGTELASMLAKK